VREQYIATFADPLPDASEGFIVNTSRGTEKNMPILHIGRSDE
jgi:hypothetical protein